MFAYIVRRLLWAVALLIVLSIVTFSIFYLVPRLAGATPETLAARYVGRAATPETVHLTQFPFSIGTGSRVSSPVPSTTTAQEWKHVLLPASDTPSSPGRQCGLSCSIVPQ